MASLVFQFGTDLLDLTNPTTPTVKTAGLYFINVTFDAVGGWNAGYGMQCFTGQYPSGPQNSDFPLADNFLHVPLGNACVILRLSPGDMFYASQTNYDTAARSLAIRELGVVRLGD